MDQNRLNIQTDFLIFSAMTWAVE